MKVIHMIVNGTPVELAVREDECLTDTLRQRLGLTSVKKGCGVGECGACTVLLDGKATNSCIYLTLWADGREIITVEGLRAKNGCLHPVQQAFVDEAAVQFLYSGIHSYRSGNRQFRKEVYPGRIA